jgi:hypothetical protein
VIRRSDQLRVIADVLAELTGTGTGAGPGSGSGAPGPD